MALLEAAIDPEEPLKALTANDGFAAGSSHSMIGSSGGWLLDQVKSENSWLLRVPPS